MNFLGASLTVVFAVTAPAGASSCGEAGAGAAGVLQVRARELWTADGKRLENAVLFVADGRVRSIGTERDLDPALPVIVHDGVVTAGLIACQVDCGAVGELQDDTRTVLPTARAMHAFDPDHKDFERVLSAGITSVVLSPTGDNLVGGLSAVVKTSGGRVLAPEASLVLSFAGAAIGRSTSSGGFSFGSAGIQGSTEGSTDEPLVAQPDGRPEWTSRSQRGTRAPTSYAGAVAMLKTLFEKGEEPFARARSGELPVTLEAWNRNEVVRAAAFAKEHGLKGAVRGAPLAGDPDVLAALKASGLGVIFCAYDSDQTRRSLEGVKLLGAAGIPVAFALWAPWHSAEDLRLFAARALWAGAPREVVWKALTSDAALLSGVSATVGTLAPGQDADFVLWSGDPLDLASRVVAVYVDGRRAWPAEHSESR